MIFETIAAIATPVGPGGVGIIRISGPQAFRITGRLFRISTEPPAEMKVSVGFVRDPESGQKVDEAVLLRFPGPKSYTTEDVAELQCHGGPAILEKVLFLCLAEGARLAAPGEFTKRAFLGGRIDLSQAEAIGDLIEARTERALENAIAQLEGTLSQELRRSRDLLLDGLARLEAAIDYPDEIDPPSPEELGFILTEAKTTIEGLLGTAKTGRILREGLHLALVGEPNVGKSSLLNRLLGTERAIVTAIPGTTRDLIEENLRLGGWLFRLSDTAGIRESEDPIERLGIERSHRVLQEADAVLLVVDATAAPAKRTKSERADLVIANKIDLLENPEKQLSAWSEKIGRPVLGISSKTGEGIQSLEASMIALAQGTPVLHRCAINARHQAALAQALEALSSAERAHLEGMPLDFLSIDLKAAILALGEVTGESVTEEVIDRVFEKFCVGK